jgi:hypothetical protein
MWAGNNEHQPSGLRTRVKTGENSSLQIKQGQSLCCSTQGPLELTEVFLSDFCQVAWGWKMSSEIREASVALWHRTGNQRDSLGEVEVTAVRALKPGPCSPEEEDLESWEGEWERNFILQFGRKTKV